MNQVIERLVFLRGDLLKSKQNGCYTMEELQLVHSEFMDLVEKAEQQLFNSEISEIQDSSSSTSSSSQAVLQRRYEFLVEDTFGLLANMASTFQLMSNSLYPMYQKLAAIKKSFQSYLKTGFFTSNQILCLQKDLAFIENTHVKDGKFMVEFRDGGDQVIPAGQAILMNMLHLNYKLARQCVWQLENIHDDLIPLFEEMVLMKQKLDAALVPETSQICQMIQKRLFEISSSRRDGKFLLSDQEGVPPKGQAILTMLLEQTYDSLHEKMNLYENEVELKEEDENGNDEKVVNGNDEKDENGNDEKVVNGNFQRETVHPSLIPIYQQLVAIKRCLQILQSEFIAIRQTVMTEQQRAKLHQDRLLDSDLILWQVRLSNIESLRVDGKFLDDDGSIPSGQTVLMELMSECHEILNTMMIYAEAEAEAEAEKTESSDEKKLDNFQTRTFEDLPIVPLRESMDNLLQDK